MPEVLIYAVGVIATLMLTAYGSEDADFLACILALAWVGSNMAYSADQTPVAFGLDLVMACTALRIWRNNQSGWRTPFLSLCVYQLIADAVLDLAGWEFYTSWARASNAIFALQLLALSWEGMINVGRRVFDRILGFCTARRSAQAKLQLRG